VRRRNRTSSELFATALLVYVAMAAQAGASSAPGDATTRRGDLGHWTAANLDPTLSLSAGSLYYVVGASFVTVDTGATVVDPDSPNFNGGGLTVALRVPDPAVMITVLNAPPITIIGPNIKWNAVTIGSFAFDGAATRLDVYFDSDATVAIVQAVVRAVGYRNSSAIPPQTQFLDFELTDGDGGTSGVVSKTVEVVSSLGIPGQASSRGGAVLRTVPSPFRNQTAILLSELPGTVARVSIFDVAGHKVRGWDLAGEGSLSRQLHWNGRGTLGGELPSGHYFIRAEGPGWSRQGSVILLR